MDREDLEVISREMFKSQLHINRIPYKTLAEDEPEKQQKTDEHELDLKARGEWKFAVFENDIAKRIFHSEAEVRYWLMELPQNAIKNAGQQSDDDEGEVPTEDGVGSDEEDLDEVKPANNREIAAMRRITKGKR